MWAAQIWHWCHFLAESGQFTREKKLDLPGTAGALSPMRSGDALITTPLSNVSSARASRPGRALAPSTAALVLVYAGPAASSPPRVLMCLRPSLSLIAFASST